jgi:hypothetical protein
MLKAKCSDFHADVIVLFLTVLMPLHAQQLGSNSASMPVSRDTQALSALARTVAALQGSSPTLPVSSLRVTGTLISARATKTSPEVSFTYDSLFTTQGTEFRRYTGAFSLSRVMVSNNGQATSSNSGPLVPPGYYRYIFQPDYVPYVLLTKALLDTSVEVKLEPTPSDSNGTSPTTVHITTASSYDVISRTMFVRHWTLDATTFLPVKSSVCLQSQSTSVCHLPIEDTYENYQPFSGIISPSVVTSRIGDKETVTYKITGIDLAPGFTTDEFTVAGANINAN